tara:strand:- start:338 stop:511 length:174 start_codon:yes stop_codon:yes gene_type:complete
MESLKISKKNRRWVAVSLGSFWKTYFNRLKKEGRTNADNFTHFVTMALHAYKEELGD